MILDLSTVDGGEVECGLCIAGAGAAGLSIALQYVDAAPGTVVVLEGGGMLPSSEGQAHYAGEIGGYPYFPLHRSRLRCFGGSTQHWAGACRPLDAVDFEARKWVEDSGWPIELGELAAYRKRAHEILDLGEINYTLQALPPDAADTLPFDPDRVDHKVWRYSMPTRFNNKYENTFDAARGVRVYLNANLVDVRFSDDTNEVTAFDAVGPDGKRMRVRARAFVLALGGLETPRLMLNADSQMANGLGNQNDLVGRCFMEHPHVPCGRLVLHETIKRGGAYRHYPFGTPGRPFPALRPVPSVQRELEILNNVFLLHFRSTRASAEGYDGLRMVARGVRGLDPDDFLEGLRAAVQDLDGLASGIYDRIAGRATYPPQESDIHCQGEQAPNGDSRVRLIEDRDALGLRRISLDWQLREIDKRSVRLGVETLGREIGRMGIGRVQLADWLRNDDPHDWGEEMQGGYHHMGTTRMSEDPKRGVVDRNCRVHGISNLFIAGSSVFPTSGSANPTLTIVELSLRLADRLEALLV